MHGAVNSVSVSDPSQGRPDPVWRQRAGGCTAGRLRLLWVPWGLSIYRASRRETMAHRPARSVVIGRWRHYNVVAMTGTSVSTNDVDDDDDKISINECHHWSIVTGIEWRPAITQTLLIADWRCPANISCQYIQQQWDFKRIVARFELSGNGSDWKSIETSSLEIFLFAW